MQPETARGTSSNGILQYTGPAPAAAPAGALEEKHPTMDSKNSGQLAIERFSNTISMALAPLQPLVDPLGLFISATGLPSGQAGRQREICRWFGIPETEVSGRPGHDCALGGSSTFMSVSVIRGVNPCPTAAMAFQQVLVDEFHCALRKSVLLQVRRHGSKQEHTKLVCFVDVVSS
jgi:hypothetical protein